jgi:hypothetical protein
MKLPAVEMQIKKIGEVKTGKSGKDWCPILLEHEDGEYTDTYEVTAFGGQIEAIKRMGVGSIVEVEMYLGSREWKDRHFASLRIASIEQVNPVQEDSGDDPF